jgi:hypothetical protein
MTKNWSRTEVTIETETLVVFRSDAAPLRAWCNGCEAETLMLTLHAAATLAGVTTQVIHERVEAGSVHFIEPPGSVLLICGLSLGVLNR